MKSNKVRAHVLMGSLLATVGPGGIVLSEPAATAVPEDTAYVGHTELKGVPGLWAVHTANSP